MNIFNVLSMGKSSLREPSISAMFAFLLNSNQDHGLGRKFLNSFLSLANNNCTTKIYEKYIDNTGIKFDIDLEVPYSYDAKRSDIDIQIKIMDSSYNELHRIIIENKINASASNPEQLKIYYEAVLHDKYNDDSFSLESENLSVIFITPKQISKGLQEEFSSLDINNKVWLYWTSEQNEDDTIVKLIQNILKQEQEATISPINEYMRHTLKAFTNYINNTINISNGKNRVGVNIGEVKRKSDIEIEGKIYTIVQRDSGQIQLYDGNDKVVARPLLIKYIDTNNIGIGDNQNTRMLGKKILDNIKQ